MHIPRRALLVAAALAALSSGAAAQSALPGDSVLRRIWSEGQERSRAMPLAQSLLDSIGPRLTGSPGARAANEWAVGRYQEWGIAARNERYGSWRGWRRGPTHVDLIEPRVRTLEARMLAWSPPTRGAVTGAVVALPESDFGGWMSTVRGKYVLLSAPSPDCRPVESWEQNATPETLARMRRDRAEAAAAWGRRVRGTGLSGLDLIRQVEAAGAAGIVTMRWSGGWGTSEVHEAYTTAIPSLDLSCEEYGLLFRLAENRQGPVLRVDARAEALGEQPVFNTIAEIRGSELPGEYVVLSAHFDSWDAASGATDNGTGTIAVMEAMRILAAVHPRPRRTIIAGHWSGEEQGLNGSRAFVQDHPEVAAGVQALFNQDTGTGRAVNVSMRGFAAAEPFFRRWLARIPAQLGGPLNVEAPGVPRSGGSDYSSFLCARAPAFDLSSQSWGYNPYTWHTNRDTYDKVVAEDLRGNAILLAMLAYLASEDERIPRDAVTATPSGAPVTWPACEPAERSTTGP